MRNFGDENLVSEPLIYMPTMVSDGVEVRRIMIMMMIRSVVSLKCPTAEQRMIIYQRRKCNEDFLFAFFFKCKAF